MSHKRRMSLFALAMLVGVVLACGSTPTPPPPTPVPPAYLRNLPTWARIECPDQESWQVGRTLWEHAEQPPSEWGSTMGNRGIDLGVIQSCESVEVVSYKWSDFGEEFWVLVDNHNGQRGWLAAKYVEFEP